MAYHHIPKYYLRGFCDNENPNCVWVYQKGLASPRLQTIINTAAEKRRWPMDVESYLSDKIESPANPILNKIRNHEQITKDEKLIVSVYLEVMIKRVDEALNRVKTMAPEIMQTTFNDINNELDNALKKHPSESEKITVIRSKFEKIKPKYEHLDSNFLKAIWYGNIPPDAKLNSALSTMRWIYLQAGDKQLFLTSDNPVFFFPSFGIGNPNSELTFPISCHITLYASRFMRAKEGQYLKVNEPIVREINRRTACNATRFVYFPKNSSSVQALANKSNYRLNRIQLAPPS